MQSEGIVPPTATHAAARRDCIVELGHFTGTIVERPGQELGGCMYLEKAMLGVSHAESEQEAHGTALIVDVGKADLGARSGLPVERLARDEVSGRRHSCLILSASVLQPAASSRG